VIWTQNPSKRAAADLHLRPRVHQDRRQKRRRKKIGQSGVFLHLLHYRPYSTVAIQYVVWDNRMGTTCIKISRKTKSKVARSGRGGPAENESPKLETEEQRQETVEQNREAGQNPPRVVAPWGEEEEEWDDRQILPFLPRQYLSCKQELNVSKYCTQTSLFSTEVLYYTSIFNSVRQIVYDDGVPLSFLQLQ
jgi:hypothetical protein